MYPFDKQNLVPYRWVTKMGLALFVCAVCLGILFHMALGMWLAVTAAASSIPVVIRFFSWNSEPTAKRQLAVLFLVMVIYGALGAVAVDTLTLKYHLLRGECPDWMFVSGRCS